MPYRLIPRRNSDASGPRRRTAGTTTLEFAAVGGLYCAMLMLIILFSLYYMRVTMLDMAVQRVSRLILIGSPPTQAQFVTDLKNESFGLLDGQTIYVAVQSASTFGAITPVTNISTGSSTPYDTGSNGDAVLIQAGYTEHLLQGLLPQFITAVSSSAAFQTEPAPQ